MSRAAQRAPWRPVFVVMFLCSWCGNQFSPLLLMYKDVQHYSELTVNMFLGVYVLGLAPALLVAGALSDRHGRRPLMLAGVITALLASGSLAFGALGPAPIYAGRLLSGITVGIAMAVGTSWMKELSSPGHEPGVDTAAGARRASLAFTLGSATGALVAGGIAQFTAFGEELPFVVHIVLTLPALWLVLRVPETSTSGGERGPLITQLRVPAAGHRRFTRVVLIAAPWIFAAAALAYGYLPVLLGDRTGSWGLGYATLLTVIALGMASLVQPIAKRLHTVSSARGLVSALAIMAVGLAVLTGAVAARSLLLGLAAAVVLGAGMGVALVSGLLEVQRIASPRDLAGLTGVFYAVAYAGFLLPTLMAALTPPLPTLVLLAAVVVLAVLSALALLPASTRHLPHTPLAE
ncbi:MFS transporter [Leifsonia sp. F6_8S_P_1B]|uniref:MFS transporter n=1 Tax=Leifsonia williamsii TaxID=3035919 RepID=A0ABT8KF18_9MICO|nr:MFS transporter [Leifsonia williamsii]MDN4616014.1 MFS transporter [Leifsonia williamsii]